jgi:hypothetical protein
LRRCQELYNAAREERRDAWQKCSVSITLAGQSAQLPDIKEVRPDYRDIHSQVLQDVRARLDRAFQAFFRRIREGQTPGYPRFHSAARYTSFTYKQVGNGAALDNGCLVLSKIGRLAVRWSRPLEGTPKTVTISREADGGGAGGGAGGGHRHGLGVLRHARHWRAHLQPALVPQSRAAPQNRPALRLTAPERKPPQMQSGHTAGESASQGEATAGEATAGEATAGEATAAGLPS